MDVLTARVLDQLELGIITRVEAKAQLATIMQQALALHEARARAFNRLKPLAAATEKKEGEPSDRDTLPCLPREEEERDHDTGKYEAAGSLWWSDSWCILPQVKKEEGHDDHHTSGRAGLPPGVTFLGVTPGELEEDMAVRSLGALRHIEAPLGALRHITPEELQENMAFKKSTPSYATPKKAPPPEPPRTIYPKKAHPPLPPPTIRFTPGGYAPCHRIFFADPDMRQKQAMSRDNRRCSSCSRSRLPSEFPVTRRRSRFNDCGGIFLPVSWHKRPLSCPPALGSALNDRVYPVPASRQEEMLKITVVMLGGLWA